ncbi:3'-5' exonuclease [Helicobacter sp. 23-1044]
MGSKPTLCIGVDFIFDIINDNANSTSHNIAILCYSRANVEKYHRILKQKDIKHSYYYALLVDNNGKYVNPQLSSLHITTFHSAKGLEFDTVIIPDFENYEKCFDKKYKSETLTQRKALYVAMTRAKENLYLVANTKIDFLKDSNTYKIETRQNPIIDIDDEIPF